jgi:hypothetical protein
MRTPITRCDSDRNAICRLVWPLRADSRGGATADSAAGLSGKTFTSESTYQAEILSCREPYNGRGLQQISQTMSFLMIGYLIPVGCCFREAVENVLPVEKTVAARAANDEMQVGNIVES